MYEAKIDRITRKKVEKFIILIDVTSNKDIMLALYLFKLRAHIVDIDTNVDSDTTWKEFRYIQFDS